MASAAREDDLYAAANYQRYCKHNHIRNIRMASAINIIIIITIKISDESTSWKNRTFTKLQSNPTSTCGTEKKKTEAN